VLLNGVDSSRLELSETRLIDAALVEKDGRVETCWVR
jgi:hypothetical protein